MSTQLTPAPDKGMSLYRIDDTLAQLISLREEMVQDDPPATEDELAVVDQQIREYMLVELPRKVASTCAIFRMWRGERALLKAERERFAKLERALEEREERLKRYVAEILERQPMPAKGCRKLEGADGSKLMLKGNGGVQPLNVNPELLPVEYFDVVVRMSAAMWEAMLEGTRKGAEPPGEVLAKDPANGRIREALAQPCGACRATGRAMIGYGVACTVCGMRKPPHGRSVPMEMANSMCNPECRGYIEDPDPGSLWPGESDTGNFGMQGPMCKTCGGTGKQGVPGASLGERGAHVEIK